MSIHSMEWRNIEPLRRKDAKFLGLLSPYEMNFHWISFASLRLRGSKTLFLHGFVACAPSLAALQNPPHRHFGGGPMVPPGTNTAFTAT